MHRVILVSALAVSSLVGCGPSAPRAVSAVAGLPEYGPTEASTFGDTLSATVFGLPAEVPPGEDTRLAERAQRADTIVLVRISTVSAESLGPVRGYSLSVVPEGPPLAGPAPDPSVELHLGADNPSLARLQSANATLIGKRFLLFMRRYAQDGEPTVHFHGEGDGPEVRKAIDSAKALDSVGDRVQTAP